MSKTSSKEVDQIWATDNYNRSCFSNSLRGRLHYSRFTWLKNSLERLDCQPQEVLELGCYDAKTIGFLPMLPENYVGLDANETALSQAREIWRKQNYQFILSKSPDEIPTNREFDISICMEIFEYLNPNLFSVYLDRLRAATRQYLFVTTPNQKGIVFASKHLVKSLLGFQRPQLNLVEIIYSTVGRLEKIDRRSRVGFDYQDLIEAIRQYFTIIEISSYPFRISPLCLGFGVCIIGAKREI